MEKPSTCASCPIVGPPGAGFLPSLGPSRPLLTFISDHPSAYDLRLSTPFASDPVFPRLLSMLGRRREEFLLGSVISCVPPPSPRTGRPWLDRAPYEAAAVNHCRPNLDTILSSAGPVVVALGDLSMRTLLDIPRLPKATMTEMHGHVIREPHGRFWVVPTFPPSSLDRGAANLTGIVLRDFMRALDVARNGFEPSEPNLVEDPSVEWFREWADVYLAAARASPSEIWLAVDIETPHGIKSNDLPTWTIERINFAMHGDEGITVPWTEPYLGIIREVLASPGVKVFWNRPFDLPRLLHNSAPCGGRIWDAADFWHVYQSDMGASDDDKSAGGSKAGTVKGNSLGFVAPIYSSAAPWKHLAESAPTAYAAKDAAQTFRIAAGVVADLTRDGMLHVATIHLSLFDQYVMGPAERVGLGVDLSALPPFVDSLKAKQRVLLDEIEALAPPEVGGLHPPQGWARRPEGALAVDNGLSFSVPVKGKIVSGPLVNRPEVSTIRRCTTCGAAPVPTRHKCKETYLVTRGKDKGMTKERTSKTLVPVVVESEERVDRWYVRLPFNPGSPVQMKAVFSAWRLPLSKGDKADKLALDDAMKKSSKNPERVMFFKCCLAWRKLSKIDGTYGTGTLRNIARQEERGVLDRRLHARFTNKPSSLRTSCVGPNLQNVVSR